jgi:hypothetical protein
MRRWCMVLLAGPLVSPRVFACATCFGTAESHQTQAVNAGILVLLGFLGTVFAMFGLAATLLYLRLRTAEEITSPGPAVERPVGTRALPVEAS